MVTRSFLNGDMLVCMSYVLSGDLVDKHELLEVYFQPLDENLEPYLKPFNISLKPSKDYVCGDDFQARPPHGKYLRDGLPLIHSKSTFHSWFKTLDLGYKVDGTPNKIILLTNQMSQLKPFMYQWLGEISYYKYFKGYHRDIETIIGFFHDVEAYGLGTPSNLNVSLDRYCANEVMSTPGNRLLVSRADQYRRIYLDLVRKV